MLKSRLENPLKGRKTQLFNGVLLVNKTENCTSHDVVQQIRKIFQQKTIGHAGTLDPMAQGLLVILMGQATKLSHYLLNNDKRYTLRMQFGLVTDTFDQEGQVLKSEPVSLEPERVKEVLKNSMGNLSLHVPCFSAVKVKGRKLYSYARQREKVDLPVRTMSFYDLNIREVTKDQALVSVSCNKGSYVRSWVHFMGEKLEVGACLIELTRDSSFPFHLIESVKVEELKECFKNGLPESEEILKNHFPKSFLQTAEALPQYPSLELTKRNAGLLFRGQIPGFLIEESMPWQIEVNKTRENKIFQAIQSDRLVALLEMQPFKKIKILRCL